MMFETAKWIAGRDLRNWRHPPVTEPPPAPYLIRDFVIEEKVCTVTLSVCGLGQAAYYLNGERLPDSVHPTQQSNYERGTVYNVFDLTPLVTVGKNRFGAILGQIYIADDENLYRMGCPRMIAEILIVYQSGKRETIVSDTSFLTHDSPTLFSQRRCGEIYDAKRAIPDWCLPESPTDGWIPAAICAGPGGAFRQKICPPKRIMEVIPGKEIAPGVYDFGKNIAGWIRLTLNVPHTEPITVAYSEWLTDDCRHTTNEGLSKTAYMFHKDLYMPAATEGEVFEPLFSYHGFRYIELTGITDVSVFAVSAHTDMSPLSSFSCNNETLNEIHRYCGRSILACTQGAMLDCPQREQNEWTGDGMLTAEVVSILFDSYRMYCEWMLNFKDSQFPSGLLPAIVPHRSNWPYSFANGLDWSSAIIHIPYYAYKYTGDPFIVTLMWENMVRAMQYFATRSETTLMSFGVGDWVSLDPCCPLEITDTAYYRIDALMMAELATALGYDPAPWTALADRIKQDFRQKYVKNGELNERSFTALIASVFAGMLEDVEIPPHVAAAAHIAEANGDALRCGIHGLRMVFDVFGAHGYNDLLFRVLTNPEKPGYARFVADRITTLPERFDYHSPKMPNGHYSSLNHQFMATVDAWFFKYVAGIRFEGFGAEHVTVSPCRIAGIHTFTAELRGIRVALCNGILSVSSPQAFTLILDGNKQALAAGSYTFPFR